MLYTNKDFEGENRNKKAGFSLVEVMMTLLILSMVMVLMAPVMTKKVTVKKNEGVVYTYSSSSLTTEDNVCFTTNLTGLGATNTPTESFADSATGHEKGCSEYSFIVPDGVDRINLTLVAGGGGGGGGGGTSINTQTHSFNKAGSGEKTLSANMSRIKKLTLDFLSSKGEDGLGITTTCTGGSGNCSAGKGGKSSSAIVNFTVPDKILRKDHTEALNSLYSDNRKIRLSNDNNFSEFQFRTNTDANIFKYQVNHPNKIATESINNCTIGTGSKVKYTESNFADTCQLYEDNIVQQVDSAGVYLLDHDEKIRSGLVLGGSNGGMLDGYSYGYGGKGADILLTCNSGLTSCNAENSSASTSDGLKAGGEAYGQVTTQIAWFSGSGGGGAAGSFVRILGFPVVPNQEYIVRVGRGGAGGADGKDSTHNDTINATHHGSDGEGGYSTSLWVINKDGDEQLVYMVNGGAGGKGGKSGNAKNKNDGDNGYSALQFPRLFVGRDYNKNTASRTVDENMLSLTPTSNTDGMSTHPIQPQIKHFNYSTYPIFKLTPGTTSPYNNPYFALNWRSFIGKNPSGSFVATENARTGGLNSFDPTLIGLNVQTEDGTTINSAYPGFLRKTIVDNAPAFVGGNGGITGLGNKAGCGGLFMGNFDGRKTMGTSSNDSRLVGKFVIQQESTKYLYSVSDFYENCTMTTPDGQSASFVTPDPVNQTFGSAGAGGGGGAFSVSLGSGKGGKGQDGYLMIDWKK